MSEVLLWSEVTLNQLQAATASNEQVDYCYPSTEGQQWLSSHTFSDLKVAVKPGFWRQLHFTGYPIGIDKGITLVDSITVSCEMAKGNNQGMTFDMQPWPCQQQGWQRRWSTCIFINWTSNIFVHIAASNDHTVCTKHQCVTSIFFAR